MSAFVWFAAFLLVLVLAAFLAAAALTATYDRTQRRLDQESGCRCADCAAGGSCAGDGAA